MNVPVEESHQYSDGRRSVVTLRPASVMIQSVSPVESVYAESSRQRPSSRARALFQLPYARERQCGGLRGDAAGTAAMRSVGAPMAAAAAV
jgi:hypothetical protein